MDRQGAARELLFYRVVVLYGTCVVDYSSRAQVAHEIKELCTTPLAVVERSGGH